MVLRLPLLSLFNMSLKLSRHPFLCEVLLLNMTDVQFKKILSVEDDAFLRDLLAQKFSGQSFTMFYAQNGEDALVIAEKEQPDLILLDIILPTMTGFETLEKLRANPATANIPVVFLSNLGQQSDIDKATALGAKEFIVKANHSLEEIIEKVKRHLVSSI